MQLDDTITFSNAETTIPGNIIAGGTISNISTTHVTASGNISASGNIVANNLRVGVTADNTTGLFISGSTFDGDARDAQIIYPTHGLHFNSSDSNNHVLALASNNVGVRIQPDSGNAALTVSGSINVIDGHITSSGNISASGNINGQSLFGGVFGRIYPDSSQTSNNQFFTADANGINSNSSFAVTGNITSSTNISASGDIIGATFGDSDGNIVFTGNVSGSGNNAEYFGSEYNAHGNDANSGFTILSLTDKPIISANNSKLQIGGIVEPEIPTKLNSNNVEFVGAITASSNISASGDIVANKVTADVVDTSFETFLNFEAATAFTFIAPFAMTINFTGSSTGSMDVVDFVTASANTETFSIRQNLPITLNIFDKLKVTPSASGLFSFSGSRTI